MKKSTKAVMTALCAVLLVAGSIFGTMAYLTSETKEVKNTFTVGKVKITLDEAKVNEYGKFLDSSDNVVDDRSSAARTEANTYKLMPGNTYPKDPTITVIADSEPCYVFAKISNTLVDANKVTYTVSDKWTKIGDSDVYYYNDNGGIVSTSNTDTVLPALFTTFKVDASVDFYDSSYSYIINDSGVVVDDNGNPKAISVIGYSVHASSTFTSATAAWEATFGASSSSTTP